MTAELSQHFRTKRDGVWFVLGEPYDSNESRVPPSLLNVAFCGIPARNNGATKCNIALPAVDQPSLRQ
ncbi:MAG: hypothetical protein M3373_13960 [Gemmatimonadota bacterium]|nr:hypothetical protein [Gemmatimonadota bacterium]